MPRHPALVPWLTALAAAIAAAAAIIAWVVVRDDGHSGGDKVVTFSSAERHAVNAAGTETANLLTFRRAHFQADFSAGAGGRDRRAPLRHRRQEGRPR